MLLISLLAFDVFNPVGTFPVELHGLSPFGVQLRDKKRHLLTIDLNQERVSVE